MAKNKKKQQVKSTRLFAKAKEQMTEKQVELYAEYLNKTINEKWLNLILAVQTTLLVSEESYKLFTDDTVVSQKLPSVAKNIHVQLKQMDRKINDLVKLFINTIDNEIVKSKFTKRFYDEAESERYMNNMEIQEKFLNNLLRNFSPGRIESYMDVLNKEVELKRPVLVRNDLHILYVKFEKNEHYLAINVMELEELARKYWIEELLMFNHETGKMNKLNRKRVKQLYDEGFQTEWIEERFKLLK